MRKKLKRSRKSNRVSWAQGDSLCQVRLFCSDDSPVKAGYSSEDCLQAKKPGMLRIDATGPNEPPPGFEHGLTPSHLTARRLCVPLPQIQWKCPPKVVLGHAWQVALGEESEEIKRQNLRELRVLEAVYPRFSSIPPSPSVSMELEREYYDDRRTPLVPLAPIEEEEAADSPSDSASAHLQALPEVHLHSGNHLPKASSPPVQALVNSLPSLTNPGIDVATAASAALAAITTSNEKGSMIDTNLLIKIFRDPEMIQRLMASGPTATSGASAAHNTATVFAPEPRMVNFSKPAPRPPLVSQESQRATVNTPSHPVSNFPPVTMPVSGPEHLFRPAGRNPYCGPNQTSAPPQPVKDMGYLKNLIRQHGAEKEENKNPIQAQNRPNYYQHQEPKPAHNLKPDDPKMISKPCMYFKSSRGCRKGPDCPFQHEAPLQWRGRQVVMEAHPAKRMKFNKDINGGMLV